MQSNWEIFALVINNKLTDKACILFLSFFFFPVYKKSMKKMFALETPSIKVECLSLLHISHVYSSFETRTE